MRKSDPWAMFTVRIRPKMSVNPEATTKNSPATVIASSSVTRNSQVRRWRGPPMSHSEQQDPGEEQQKGHSRHGNQDAAPQLRPSPGASHCL